MDCCESPYFNGISRDFSSEFLTNGTNDIPKCDTNIDEIDSPRFREGFISAYYENLYDDDSTSRWSYDNFKEQYPCPIKGEVDTECIDTKSDLQQYTNLETARFVQDLSGVVIIEKPEEHSTCEELVEDSPDENSMNSLKDSDHGINRIVKEENIAEVENENVDIDGYSRNKEQNLFHTEQCDLEDLYLSQHFLKQLQNVYSSSNAFKSSIQSTDNTNHSGSSPLPKFEIQNGGHSPEKVREQRLICDECGRKFKNGTLLMYHMRAHKGEKPYECQHCDRKFTANWMLTRHVKVHTGDRPFNCSQCDRKFFRQTHLDRHLMAHSSAKPFVCDECNKEFKRKSDLQRHVKKHASQTPYECNFCHKIFSYKSRLAAHVKIHSNVKSFICTHCGEGFARKTALESHCTIHGINPHVCTTCLKKFSSKWALQRHALTHTGVRPFHCYKCSKKFPRQSHLDRHLMFHLKEKEKTFGCPDCGEIYTRRIDLMRHMPKHGVKVFDCHICTKQFTREERLNQHILKKHAGESVFDLKNGGEILDDLKEGRAAKVRIGRRKRRKKV